MCTCHVLVPGLVEEKPQVIMVYEKKGYSEFYIFDSKYACSKAFPRKVTGIGDENMDKEMAMHA